MPTAVPVDPIDAAKIAIAAQAYDADPQPMGLVAHDHLTGRVVPGTGDGDLVELDVCGWTGVSTASDAYVATYLVTDPDGDSATATASATFESVAPSPAGCLDSSLVAAAFEATRNYDIYWTAALADPNKFELAQAAESMTLDLVDSNYDFLQSLLADGLSHQNGDLDGQLPVSSLTDVLYRRYDVNGRSVLQLAACRVLPETYGLYRGQQIQNDFRDADSGRSNAIAIYDLTVVDGEFKVMGFAGRAWASCDILDEEWLSGLNTILPDPVPWAPIVE